MEIKDAVKKYVNGVLGINTPYIDYFEKIQEYLSWYRGETDWHEYKRWNGFKRLTKHKYSLDMAKTCCEDMASLVGIEKMDIHFEDDRAKKFVDSVLRNNNFRVNASQLLELMFALGTMSFAPTVQGQNIIIDYIQGDAILPLSWDNGKITEVAFITNGGESDKCVATLTIHKVNDNGMYTIKQVEIDAKGQELKQKLSQISEKDIEEADEVQTMTSMPQFSICKTNIVNNYDKINPLGMSIFGNAIYVLKGIDETYDSLHNEFKEGKKRIFIKSDLKSIRMSEEEFDNSVYSQVDPNDSEFFQVGSDTEWNNGKPPIYESNMSLRVSEHQQGLEMLLNLLSKKVGLGEHYYTFDKGGVQTTATAVISAKSDLFRNIKRQELAVEQSIVELCRIILNLSNIHFGTNFDINQDICVDFDDSIIEDKESIQRQALEEYNGGLIDKIEYHSIVRKMTREQATEYLNKMEQSNTMKEYGGMLEDMGFGIGGNSE